jgi:hypothetical protein
LAIYRSSRRVFCELFHVKLCVYLNFHSTNNDQTFSEHGVLIFISWCHLGWSQWHVCLWTQTKHITCTCYSRTITDRTFLISSKPELSQIWMIERTAANIFVLQIYTFQTVQVIFICHEPKQIPQFILTFESTLHVW